MLIHDSVGPEPHAGHRELYAPNSVRITLTPEVRDKGIEGRVFQSPPPSYTISERLKSTLHTNF